jgi:hypothetical protein
MQDRSVVGGGPFGDQSVPLRWVQTTLDLFTETGHFVRTGPDPVPLDTAEKPGGCGQVPFRQSKTEGLRGDPSLDLSIEQEETVGSRREFDLGRLETPFIDVAADRTGARPGGAGQVTHLCQDLGRLGQIVG